jgi:TolA-binding protein
MSNQEYVEAIRSLSKIVSNQNEQINDLSAKLADANEELMILSNTLAEERIELDSMCFELNKAYARPSDVTAYKQEPPPMDASMPEEIFCQCNKCAGPFAINPEQEDLPVFVVPNEEPEKNAGSICQCELPQAKALGHRVS